LDVVRVSSGARRLNPAHLPNIGLVDLEFRPVFILSERTRSRQDKCTLFNREECMPKFLICGVAAAALLVAAVTPAVPQDIGPFDKLVYLTFSAPVQVPGATLNAGRYRFRLTNAVTSRNVMQVLSNDETTVYAMFNTIQDHREWVTVDPIVTFRETPAGEPPAIKSLFYGDTHNGYEFVYPKGN
jgi:hypothetical protein